MIDHHQSNPTLKYQLVLLTNYQPNPHAKKFPTRDTWEEAAEDAIRARVARWKSLHELEIFDGRALISRVYSNGVVLSPTHL